MSDFFTRNFCLNVWFCYPFISRFWKIKNLKNMMFISVIRSWTSISVICPCSKNLRILFKRIIKYRCISRVFFHQGFKLVSWVSSHIQSFYFFTSSFFYQTSMNFWSFCSSRSSTVYWERYIVTTIAVGYPTLICRTCPVLKIPDWISITVCTWI